MNYVFLIMLSFILSLGAIAQDNNENDPLKVSGENKKKLSKKTPSIKPTSKHYFYKSRDHFFRKKYDEALKEVEQALLLKPDYHKALKLKKQILVSIAHQNKEVKLVLSLPHLDWSLEMKVRGFKTKNHFINNAEEKTFLKASNRDKRTNIYLSLKKAPVPGNAKDCRSFYWSEFEKKNSPKSDIIMTETGNMAIVEYFSGHFNVAGKRDYKQIKIYIAEKGYCINAHLSTNMYQPEDKKFLNSLIDSITIKQNYRPDSQMLFCYGKGMMSQGNYSEAISYLSKTVELEAKKSNMTRQNLIMLFNCLGMSYRMIGDLNNTINVFQNAIQKEPESWMLYYNLACSYAENDDIESSLKFLALAYQHKGNKVFDNMIFPDPMKDDSFKKYISHERFRQLIDEKNIERRGQIKALQPCAALLIRHVPRGSNYSSRLMINDYFFTLDERKLELYLFSPFYAGKTNIEKALNGQEYNIMIPYLPPDSPDKHGYYYLTANYHNKRIKVPPRFLPGPPQPIPDFSKRHVTKEGITLLSIGSQGMYEKSMSNYHLLDNHQKIWNPDNLEDYDEKTLDIIVNQVIIPSLKRLDDRLNLSKRGRINGYRFSGAPPLEQIEEEYRLKYISIMDIIEKVPWKQVSIQYLICFHK